MTRKFLAVALAALCSTLSAQIVHVANSSDIPFNGWKRCTVDVMPPHTAGHVTGTAGTCDYVLGRRVGLDTHVIDLRLNLAPWTVASFDLSASTPWNFVLGPLPTNGSGLYGSPSIGGVPMQVISAQADGAGYLMHYRVRPAYMLCADLWVLWRPDRPGWAQGEIVVTASDPSVPDVKAVIPPGFHLQWGGSLVHVPDLPFGAPLLPADTEMGDGQARSFPVVMIWPARVGSFAEAASALLQGELRIAANGIANLWPEGNPRLETGEHAGDFAPAYYAGARARLHNWLSGPVGVEAYSRQTGNQEDQVFVGAECTVMPEGLGAEIVRYLAALGQSRRPCHHLEENGEQLSLTTHPQLVIWDSRAHWHTTVSPDRLGKAHNISSATTHRWWGPDEEHLLLNTLSIAARLTGSPALQWQLGANARAFIYQKTIDPGLSTTRPGPSRAVGWEGIAAVHLWTNLEDRALAQLIRQRWIDRVNMVFLPALSQKPGGIWDPRVDPRLEKTGWKENWAPYQQSVAAWGLDYGCRILGPAQGRTLALHAALTVGLRAFSQVQGQWIGWGFVGYDGATMVPLVQGAGAHFGAGIAQWNKLAVATFLAHDPTNPLAQSIWAQWGADGGHWVPPGL